METSDRDPSKKTLLVGFDAAWTATNKGALVGVLVGDGAKYIELGSPRAATYCEAERTILEWQAQHDLGATIVLLDQPTIVKNATGQRPVENIVGSPVSRRYGGVQPANTGKADMFGKDAPVWPFLDKFGGAANPLGPITGTCVFETYPVLAMIALDWMLHDSRPTGRLPKYNPSRKNFSHADWRHVCQKATDAFRERELSVIAAWLESTSQLEFPRKRDQDCLDACICLLTAIYAVETKDCLMVGELETGYIVTPYGQSLSNELEARCREKGRDVSAWVRRLRWPETGLTAGARLSSSSRQKQHESQPSTLVVEGHSR
jgi:predicted RNase H-like nuclease